MFHPAIPRLPFLAWRLILWLAALFWVAYLVSSLWPHRPPNEAYRYFSPDFLQRAETYHRARRLAFAVDTLLGFALLAALAGTRAGAALDGWTRRVLGVGVSAGWGTWAPPGAGLRVWLAAALYVVILMLLQRLVSLPAAWYSGYCLEHRYGFSHQTLPAWGADVALSFVLNLAFYRSASLAVLALIARWPGGWWAPAAAMGIAVAAALIYLSPVIIDPLFYKFTPLPAGELRSELLAMADRAGIKVDEILVMNASVRTSKVNAYFTGLGGTRRIVLYDNLLKGYGREQVAAIVAHEMGHWRHAHVLKGFLFGALGIALGLFLLHWLLPGEQPVRGPRPALLPLLLLGLALLSFVSSPAQNGLSRSFERQADREVLRLLGAGPSYAQVQVRLARENLAQVSPPAFIYWFSYTHPSDLERIKAAEQRRP